VPRHGGARDPTELLRELLHACSGGAQRGSDTGCGATAGGGSGRATVAAVNTGGGGGTLSSRDAGGGRGELSSIDEAVLRLVQISQQPQR